MVRWSALEVDIKLRRNALDDRFYLPRRQHDCAHRVAFDADRHPSTDYSLFQLSPSIARTEITGLNTTSRSVLVRQAERLRCPSPAHQEDVELNKTLSVYVHNYLSTRNPN